MKTDTSHLGCLALIAALFMLQPFKNADASYNPEHNRMGENYQQRELRRRQNLSGQRKGFIIGFGVGAGTTRFTEPLAQYYWRSTQKAEWETARQTRSALITELKIGHGFSNQFLLYYTSRIAWLPLQHFTNDTMIANGAAGIGFMYFPLRRFGLYLVGNMGLATLVTWQPPLTLENARQTGVIFSGGIGYQILPHLNLDFTVSSGSANTRNVDDISEIEIIDEVVTYAITLNLLAY
ncbi:hypothetical protein F4054_23095 [Candidatus Poribacteria bacterium]|nr:hypothetical protein [Candidatus Poribacteria bacterium]MYG07140.1 hypothetical protein [Candidatus Poribacteria bacterium]MYK25140.1 hypothetical protein [Candidatus Poribacteria bacterium]